MKIEINASRSSMATEVSDNQRSNSRQSNSLEPAFIYRSLKIALGVTLLTSLFAARYFEARFALGVLCGGVWNIANLWLITLLVTTMFSQDEQRDQTKRKRRKLILWAAMKFPLLYGGGIVALLHGARSMEVIKGVLVGFSILFMVIILKIIGRILVEKSVWGDRG